MSWDSAGGGRPDPHSPRAAPAPLPVTPSSGHSCGAGALCCGPAETGPGGALVRSSPCSVPILLGKQEARGGPPVTLTPADAGGPQRVTAGFRPHRDQRWALAVNVLPELQCLQLGRRCRAGSPHRGLRVVPREAQGWGRWPPGGGSWSMPRSSPARPTSLSALGTLQHWVRWAPEGRADLAPAPAPRIRVQVLVPRHRMGIGMKALNGFVVSSGCSALHPRPQHGFAVSALLRGL